MAETQDLFDVRDGRFGRSNQISTRDMELRAQAEVERARLEGREPNLEPNAILPPTVGTVLVLENELPSYHYDTFGPQYADGKTVADPLITVEIPEPQAEQVDLSQAAQIARERLAQDKILVDETGNAASRVVVDTDQDAPGDTDPGVVTGEASNEDTDTPDPLLDVNYDQPSSENGI